MEYGGKWMNDHRKQWGDRMIKDLCIPASHDSGAYNLQWQTWGGIDSNVVTQSKTIGQQLELGVRKFDIRPKLVPKAHVPWSCGHGTEDGLGKWGWQGGTGASIQNLVDDVNSFTKYKAELIILNIGEVNVIRWAYTGPPGDFSSQGFLRKSPDGTEWLDLLNLFKGLDFLYKKGKVSHDGKPIPADRPLQEYKLNDFIGYGQSAVVVLFGDYDNHQDLYNRGFWPPSCMHLEGLSDLTSDKYTPPVYLSTLCRMMSHKDAIKSFITGGGAISIASLARNHHGLMFPLLLHRVLWEKKDIQTLEMDFVTNLDLLTFCLAITEHRYNLSQKSNKMVVYYSAKPITKQMVLDKMQEAINAGKPFKVNSIEGIDGNPRPEGSKCCVVLYPHNELTKGRYGRQDDWLHFEHDVLKVFRGSTLEVNQRTYYNFWQAVGNENTLHFKNDPNLGLDSQNGDEEYTVEFRKRDSTKIEKRSGKGSVDFDKSLFDKMADITPQYQAI